MNLQLHRPRCLVSCCHPPTFHHSLADPAENGVEACVPLPLEVDWLLLSAEEILYDATDWWRWVVKLLGHVGLQTHYDALYAVWRRDYLDSVNRREVDYWTAFRHFLRAVGLRPAQIAELLVAAQPRRRQFERELRCLPSVAPVLRGIFDGGIPMGVVSCAPLPAEKISDRLRALGLADFFSFVVTAWDMECDTSQPMLYERLIRERGCRPDHAALIGQDAMELAAAAEAGMATVSYNQHRDVRPDVRVHHLGQLTQILIPRTARRMAG